MKIGNLQVDNPVALGPMAGVTDWAFRTICAELGANITVTEMVSSRALVYKDKKSAALLRKNEGEQFIAFYRDALGMDITQVNAQVRGGQGKTELLPVEIQFEICHIITFLVLICYQSGLRRCSLNVLPSRLPSAGHGQLHRQWRRW